MGHPEWTEIMQAMNKRGANKDKADPSSLYAFVNGKVDEGYDAIVSSPLAFYTLDVLRRWPKAKVILTTHDNKREWFSLMQTGTQKALHRDMVKAEYHRLTGCQLPPADADLENCTDGYDIHSNKIRKKVPKSQFLEFKLEKGWEPNCEFLGVPVPNAAFPWSKENKTTSKIIIFAGVFGVLLVVLLVAAITLSASPSDGKKDDRGADATKAGSNSKRRVEKW